MLPDQDSNLDKQNQNLSYYHYTIGQSFNYVWGVLPFDDANIRRLLVYANKIWVIFLDMLIFKWIFFAFKAH